MKAFTAKMSATSIAILPPETDLADSRPLWNSRTAKWWARISSRCAGPDCPHRGKLWPSLLRKTSGLEFDGRWYCQSACLASVLSLRLHALLSTFHQEKPRAHRFPIGLLLVQRGAVSREALREAIRLQREAGHGLLGDWLQQVAPLTSEQLTAALAQQWGCPVFPLEHQPVRASWSDLIPLPLLESARAVPAFASADGRALHLAFGDRLDHTLLYAVENMLGCRTFPCVASRAAIALHLEHFRRFSSGNETCFDTIRDPHEMARTVCNYAAELRAARIAVARAGSFVWVRFFRDLAARDLLFRILPGYLEKAVFRSNAYSNSADSRKGGVSGASGSL
jgi:hypothetical protein